MSPMSSIPIDFCHFDILSIFLLALAEAQVSGRGRLVSHGFGSSSEVVACLWILRLRLLSLHIHPVDAQAACKRPCMGL